MKIAHRKTLWVHTTYAVIVSAVLASVIVLKRDVPNIVIVLLIGSYIIGHVIIHLKRDDLRRDTVLEYILGGVAVGVVLIGVLHR